MGMLGGEEERIRREKIFKTRIRISPNKCQIPNYRSRKLREYHIG